MLSTKTKKRIVMITAVIIVVLMILGVLAPIISSSAQTTGSLDSQYAQLQQQQQALEKKQKELKGKISANKSDQAAVKETIQNISSNMKTLKSQMDILSGKIYDCNTKISKSNQDIAATQKRIDQNNELYKERVCAMYEAGPVSELQVLLSSKSIMEFLTSYDTIKMIQQHDTDLITQLKSDKSALESDKKAVVSEKDKLVATQTQLSAKQSDYDSQFNESNSLYNQLSDKNSELKKQQDEIDKEEDEANAKIEEIIREKQKEAEANGGSTVYVGGTWLWPIQNCPGQYISSPFGPRSGHSTPHTGIDIAAGGISGHPILASNSGKVIIAGWDSSGIYGNYVVIDHGGGYSTLYGHCSGLNTSVGATVSRGQVIGYVGNTGNVVSTGGGR